RLSDIAQVMEIEKASFPTAWPASAFRREIQQNRLARYIVALEPADGGVPARPLPTPARPSAPVGPSPFQRRPAGLQRLVGGAPAGDDRMPAGPERPFRQVAGYLGLWLMVDEAHVTTIAVAPAHRRRGLGEHLLIASFEIAAEMQANVVTL